MFKKGGVVKRVIMLLAIVLLTVSIGYSQETLSAIQDEMDQKIYKDMLGVSTELMNLREYALEKNNTEDWQKMINASSKIMSDLSILKNIKSFISLYDATSPTCRSKRNAEFVNKLANMLSASAYFLDMAIQDNTRAVKYEKEYGLNSVGNIYKQEIVILEDYLSLTQKAWKLIIDEQPWLIEEHGEELL